MNLKAFVVFSFFSHSFLGLVLYLATVFPVSCCRSLISSVPSSRSELHVKEKERYAHGKGKRPGQGTAGLDSLMKSAIANHRLVTLLPE